MKNILTTLCLLITLTAFASDPTSPAFELEWNQPVEIRLENGTLKYELWSFDGAIYERSHPGLPYFFYRFPVSGPGKIQAQLEEAIFESFNKKTGADDAYLQSNIQIETYITQERGQYFGNVKFIPIKYAAGGYERLTSFKIETSLQAGAANNAQTKNGDYADLSVLADGDVYKIAVTSTGIHKLDYNFLVSELGIDPSVDPRKIQVLGNGGGMLPELVGAFRHDDLQENAIFFSGEADGQLDNGDYILFYGEGPSKWRHNEEEGIFDYELNPYDEENYYFLKVASENGLRIESQASVSGSYTSTSFDAYLRKEDDNFNLLNDYSSAQGSGRDWFGDQFKIQRTYTYSDGFSFPNIRTDEPANIKVRLVARSSVSGTNANVKIAGQTFYSENFTKTDVTDQDDPYATSRIINETFTPNNENLSVTLNYPLSSVENLGWVDYVQLNVRRSLAMASDQFAFRDLNTLDHPSSTFQISNASGSLSIWDVTDPILPKDQAFSQNGSTVSFGINTDELKEFVAFRPNGNFLNATAVGKVTNQNLHGIDEVDFVIVYHRDLEAEAQRFADHRANNSNLEIALVPVDQVYNEFSSGRMEATAIRDFAKMLYTKYANFQYMLLFGDGSFDHRNITGLGNNFIPTYETSNSLDPILAFPSDDFYCLLDDGEGQTLAGDLDIAIGRFPVRNLEEAKVVVDKLINYDNSPAALGDWRNRMLFVGDDEDGGTHARDADEIAEAVNLNKPFLNLDKVYVDAYNQISTPGGQRVPTATEAVNQNMFKGVLAITYLGHGGPKGWAQERILQIPDIISWTNFNKLPVFITATCTFSGYDDPSFTSAGESTLLNGRGGAIALFTTVRPVLSTSNKLLTKAVTDTLFSKVNGEPLLLGEVMRIAKNAVGGQTNSRKFTLLGDPTMQLALPQYNVVTTHVNDVDISQAEPDTIRALQKVTIAGEVRDDNGNLLDDFDGEIFPTVFDKAVMLNTLGQDNTPVREYRLQKSTLFKGRASVIDGKFSFTFVVPKDINYQYGYGKVSYYADDGVSKDASGLYSGLTIGGTDANALVDNTGPNVEVYMDSKDFVFGGITSEDPILLVVLEDDNGINVVGNSIGHDLTGILDENTQNTYLLNDFYEAALDDHTKGEVRFPFDALAEGRHGIFVKAFDVANNSATGYTEFVVASSGKVALEHVLNYPNPFIDNTCFQFEHNMSGQSLDVLIQIYTVSGRLVKTIDQRISPLDNRLSLDDCIEWDGRDDFGDTLARGVYIYKIKVRAADTGSILLEGESDFEKLVILK